MNHTVMELILDCYSFCDFASLTAISRAIAGRRNTKKTYTVSCPAGAGWQASTGQTSAQAPHSVHNCGSMMKGLPSLIAPSGHSGKHAPHAMQLSRIWYDISSTTISGRSRPSTTFHRKHLCKLSVSAMKSGAGRGRGKKFLSGQLNRDYLFNLRHPVFNRALDPHDQGNLSAGTS